MATPSSRSAQFLTTDTVHRAFVGWWWTERRLHDQDYCVKVQDAVDAAVKDVEVRFGVRNNVGLCCQWEGIEFEGDDLEKVTAAGAFVAAVLARFKGVRPL